MRIAVFSVLMLFAVSGYAKLDCESEQYSYNPTVKELCEEQNEKMEETKKENVRIFNERLLQGKQLNNLRDLISKQQNAASQPIVAEPVAPATSSHPTMPTNTPIVAPSTPVITPSTTPPAATPSNIKYY